MTKNFLPELLAPAGSFDALCAALSAGADAVYLGLESFNARAGAENFTLETLEKAVKLTKLYQKKLYLTLNTLVFDKEIGDVVKSVEKCMALGVDAFIVQDFGLISLLKSTFPNVVIHASTQCATHNLAQINTLAEMGVSRAVAARELSRRDLEIILKNSPIEIEAFVHGALCMSHSGTCLMSYYMGGRSGNRGECAQPCRLPYRLENSKNPYPLSLSDLSLAPHAGELISLGVHSLKLEGRMKSCEYVGRVTSIWRRLLDERRGANNEEMAELESIFSRSGFTDGYYLNKKGSEMFGTRRESDKEKTRTLEKTSFELPRIPVTADFSLEEDRARLVYSCRGICATADCDVMPAEGEGTGADLIAEALKKLGSTPFSCDEVNINLPYPVFIKRSSLNEARRRAVSELEKMLVGEKSPVKRLEIVPPTPSESRFDGYFAVFREGAEINPREIEKLLEKKEILKIFLPFSYELDCPSDKCGILLPRAVFDREWSVFEKRLSRLLKKGYKSVFCENLGVAMEAKKLGFSLFGGAGLNTTNSYSEKALFDLGFEAVVLSHELTAAQKREIIKSGPVGECVFGRAPLMLVENCPVGTRDACHSCDKLFCHKKGALTDRQNEVFPIIPDYSHRALIYNSRPTNVSDTPPASGLNFRVIYITDEKPLDTVERVLRKEKPFGKFTRK